ncbi:MAG TPA: M20/M25/M40 family metallo-hydrolase [Thermoanaerobaculia bacterium]|nr:M20/M25/M40 family metallo-hydrolase [Thermoanaerobaculia bacterium]
MSRRATSLLSLLVFAACATAPPPVAESRPAVPLEAMQALVARADLVRAFEAVERDREGIVAQWREITEIPAPSGHEAKRAERVESLLRQYGLTDVRRDAAGNVMGTRRGTGGGKRVVLDAHLDTVFALGTNVTTRVENGRIHAPGVGDNTRNVVALLAAIRAMNGAQLQTKGDLTFLFTVEEETNFRGVDQFLADHRANVDRFVALDGGYSNFTYGGTGIYWHRYHILGPGGHTRSGTPPYSATLPIARAIERVYALPLPNSAWLNIGMLGGADVFNSKAADAWMSVDLRSTVQSDLQRLDATIQQIVEEEAKRVGMTSRREKVSTEEVASLPGHRNSEMVATVEAVFRAFGFEPEITPTAANHTSAALRAGIPAVGMGTAPCEGAHALHESCEIEPFFKGIQRTIAIAVALSE